MVRVWLRKNMAQNRHALAHESKVDRVVRAARRALFSQVSRTRTDDECSRFTDHGAVALSARSFQAVAARTRRGLRQRLLSTKWRMGSARTWEAGGWGHYWSTMSRPMWNWRCERCGMQVLRLQRT